MKMVIVIKKISIWRVMAVGLIDVMLMHVGILKYAGQIVNCVE
ncbi:MAG: hypothetical protein ACE5J2_03530 [Nitrososphaerales archaeon]